MRILPSTAPIHYRIHNRESSSANGSVRKRIRYFSSKECLKRYIGLSYRRTAHEIVSFDGRARQRANSKAI